VRDEAVETDDGEEKWTGQRVPRAPNRLDSRRFPRRRGQDGHRL